MLRKLIFVVVFCLLGIGGYAFGSWETDFAATWHNGYGDYPATKSTGEWFDPCNWAIWNGAGGFLTPRRPPNNLVWAGIEAKGDDPCISTSDPNYVTYGPAECARLDVQPWSWQYAPDIRFTLVDGDFNCGALIGLCAWDRFPSTWGGAILDVNGGTIFTGGIPNVVDWSTLSDGEVNQSDLDPNNPWWGGRGVWVGGGSTGTGENWGSVNIRNTGRMIVPRIMIYNGEINIFPDGLLYQNDPCTTYFVISNARARNKINVEGGELRLMGDRRDQVLEYLAKNRLIPCKGHGDLHTDFNGTDTSVTSTCTPDSAWNPNPIDGAIAVPLNKVLSWSAGTFTATVGDNNAHAVYFGTDFNEVNEATTSTPVIFKGWQDACSFNPGALVMDTNYFWRIDEHNDVNVWTGNMWEFKSKGPQATDPIPADEATGIPLPIVLKWSPGALAAGPNSHAVYFGTSQDAVTTASVTNPKGVYQGYVANPVFPLSSLTYGLPLLADVDYYWRIDESDGTSVWKGAVWHVYNTNYYVAEDFDLYTDTATMRAKWKMGSTAPPEYESCTATNSNGVIDYDMNDGENKHMQYDYDDSYGYFFSEVRFDANGGSASGSDWTGGGALPADNKCRSLAIGFRGNVNNQANGDYDRMYAAIEDTAGNFGMVLNSESQAQRTFGWTQWYIDLNDFNENGTVHMKLANIKYLYLGFGDRPVPPGCEITGPAGGTGRVSFDDFRLYQKTCLPQFLPVGDFSGDCKVDLTDLDTMANTWAAKAITISPVTNPGTTGLRLWYKFDETTGTTITDSSGNNFNGEVNCTPTFGDNPLGLPTTILWDPTGGYDGSSCFISSPIVIRDYNMMIDAGKGALSPTQTSITFSIWINGDTYMPLSGWARLISACQDMNAGANDENEVIEIECPIPRADDRCWSMFSCGVKGDGNAVGTSQNMPLSAFAGSWQHYAFVRAGADGNVSDANYNKIYIYHNGERIVDANALRPIFGSTTPYDGNLAIENFRLTSMNFGAESYYGKIDDFRVYNRALSAAEVGWLGTKGTGNVPFQNASNIKVTSPDKISFNDMAMLAKNWLTFQSWPNP